ncbi:MAG: hypothetical protein ACW98D_09430 [Promethearchaeota archaeon]|jgi:hypothetical protein
MISKVMVIKSNGLLCYSKAFRREDKMDDDFISGFLTTILDISQKIGGGEVRSLNFRNFNIRYSYDKDKLCIFILVADIDDPEKELNEKLQLMKTEFMVRYKDNLINWDDEISKFEKFDDFTLKNIYLPPQILFVGENGVGKTSLLNLFPGEILIELDDDMNVIIQKSINLPEFNRIKKCEIIEIDVDELINNPKGYQQFLESANIFCFVTNSGASNLARTKNYFSSIKSKVKRAEFYVIANFQDMHTISFEPEKIEELFGIKAFGFSAIKENASEELHSIIIEILSKIILE